MDMDPSVSLSQPWPCKFCRDTLEINCKHMSLICCLPLHFSYQCVWDGMGHDGALCPMPGKSYWVTQRISKEIHGNSFNDSLMIFECCACAWFDDSHTAWMSQHEVLDGSEQLEGSGAWCF